MTTIVIYKNNENFVGYECYGHSGYGEYGSDIVCAAISTLVQSTAMGIEKIVKADCKISSNEKKGTFKLVVSKAQEDKSKDINLLINTMKFALLDLEIQFPKNIKLEEETYVY